MSDLPVLKIPEESRLLKMFDTMGDAITGLHTRINKTLLQDAERRWLSDSQNELREFYKTDVIPMSRSLYKNLKEIKEELIEEVQKMLNIFESMESKVDRILKKNEILQNKIDQLLEANIANDVKNLVMQSYMEIKNNEEIERFSKESKDSEKFLMMLLKSKKRCQNKLFNFKKILPNLRHKALILKLHFNTKLKKIIL
ncbi:hypothetical protein Tco_0794357 [Tanacetum coccineum]